MNHYASVLDIDTNLEVERHGPFETSDEAYRKCYALDRTIDLERHYTVLSSRED